MSSKNLTAEAVESKVLELAANRCQRGTTISVLTSLSSIGFDDIDAVELVVDIEDAFNVGLDDDLVEYENDPSGLLTLTLQYFIDATIKARGIQPAHERLVELAGSSPTFAPGAENYRRMGAIEAIWPVPSAALLEAALGQQSAAGPGVDGRMNAGLERGGRKLAAETVAAVLAA